jgi:membrane protein
VKLKPRKLKLIYELLYDTIRAGISGNVVSEGAALAYYTIFAIAPLFIIALAIAGFWFGEDAAKRELFGQVNQLVGKQGGEAIQSLVAAAGKSRDGFWATCIAGGTLAVAATGVFVQLQNSLNKIWNVRQARGKGLRNFIRHRLLSFAMVFGIGFLLLVSLVCSAALAALGNYIGDYVSGKEILLKALDFVISLGIITVLFAMIFKFLPDVKIAWRDVWLGGFITAIFFNAGKYVIGIYIGHSSISSVYGAMGSLVVVLVWVYYSAQILFFGAQFTCIYAGRFGVKPEPLHNAEFIPAEIERPQKTSVHRK